MIFLINDVILDVILVNNSCLFCENYDVLNYKQDILKLIKIEI